MWQVVRGDARAMPLADASVDLIVTSPPYWGLRSYRDGGEHYDGQVGAESSPQGYVDELVGMINSEWRRVLKPSGSLWLNLGDKYAGAGGAGTTTQLDKAQATKDSPLNYPKGLEVARPKSLLGLPWRVAIALIDRGWILRAEVIWSKPNGLPESVKDRVRRSHEQWFHFTLSERYYSAVDRIREPYSTSLTVEPPFGGTRVTDETDNRYSAESRQRSALGRMPGSVRSVPTQPLIIPDEAKQALGLTDHFAAFPMEWPRWIIEGWSPEKVCTVCGEGRSPVVSRRTLGRDNQGGGERRKGAGTVTTSSLGGGGDWVKLKADYTDIIVGEACACTPRTSHRGKRGDWKQGREAATELNSDDFHKPGAKVPRRKPEAVEQGEWEYHLDQDPSHPTVPGVVLDPFGGTGTTAGIAHHIGRTGISIDLSADYCRLAQWRIAQSGQFQKWLRKDKKPTPPASDDQLKLLP